ncbi:cutinase family protein [Nocardioides sp.]|uniref:RCC1 domain-containing protein n=1 Tax=Nocardioides sp. TaxID=35761 RepID=UPI002ED11863
MTALAVAVVVAVAGSILVVLPGGWGAGDRERPGAETVGAVPECADAVLVAVPGARQVPGGSTSPGPTLTAYVEPVVAAAEAVGRSVTTAVVAADTLPPTALRGRGTPRTPAERAVTRAAWKTWRSSVPGLVTSIGSTIAAAVAACPDQLVYLVGHSQGAEAVHRYLNQADASLPPRTVAVVLVGDPARVSGSRGRIIGDPAAPRAAEGVSARRSWRPTPAVPDPDWHAPLVSVCTRGDVACDLGPTRFRTAQQIHRRYSAAAGSARLATLATRHGTRLALWPKPLTGQQVEGQAGLLMNQRVRVKVADQARAALRFAATSALPSGLRLTARGVLSGTPAQTGTFEVGYTVRNSTSADVARKMPGSLTVTVVAGARSEVSSGGRHTCQLRGNGTVWCWGANFYGQLGTGDHTGGPTPRQVGAATDWTQVSAGGMHTCGVRENGTLWCWGLNYRGQLGTGGRQDKTKPVRVGTASDWVSVASGWVHTCATRADGSAWCWGDNDYGQLGAGSQKDQYLPVRVRRGLVWSEIAAGGWHTCGVTQAGAAYCWGRNIKGQLGDGTDTVRINPARVGDASDWVTVQPAWTHTCGLKVSGALLCWGGNEGGQLGGSNGFGGSPTPQPLPGERLWSAVDTGVNFSCALDTDRRLWCWGTGRFGQLGDTERTNDPVPMFEDRQWSQLELGWLFGCGLADASSTPSCWGTDETGELGPTGTRPSPRGAATSSDGFGFTLVSFNVLGSNHTSPRKDAGEFSPARIRSEWSIDHLRSVRAGIVGFQELQRDQLGWFTQGAGSRYAVWPGDSQGGRGLQTTIAWRRDVWRRVAQDLVPIPFIAQTRYMPLVQLQHRATGRKIWVMNIHNAPQDHQSQRNTAVRREIKRLKRVVGRGQPVFLLGDFNERQRAFCEITGKLGLVAPRGGSYSGGRCYPPSGKLRVDWIYGSKDVAFSRYREDRTPLVKLMTDHAVLRVRVRVP